MVIPVYRGAKTLPALVNELAEYLAGRTTPEGRRFAVVELVLAWDCGPDRSDLVIRELAAQHEWIRPVWLSRNFGQHAATVAGMTATDGDWIVTMDEDGQHDPRDIGRMLDRAFDQRATLVYASPINKPPHSLLRNIASWTVKTVFLRLLSPGPTVPFHSFRLVGGEQGRSVAAYMGPGVYLDVALGWVIARATTCPVHMRDEGRAASNYRTRQLLSHFWRLVLSSGTRPLRIVSGLGLLTAALGLVLAVWLVVERITGATSVQGWTSAIVAELVVGGVIMISLGVIAEYVGTAASMSMGKPLYVVVGDPYGTFLDENPRDD
ncbi:glycosyltransferase [Cellulomonas sp. WB94]|uniref:glycosyltransferase n=1 Tax=Cellulomonas sp. WB94 TaxID=2173174 RepID=UPI001F5B67FB|nr:glycosyltransferase [Cellulomonas sp. WB94]